MWQLASARLLQACSALVWVAPTAAATCTPLAPEVEPAVALLPPTCALPAQVNEFQTQCKKLPLALRDWAAYKDCRRTIDDFLDLLPLFQALAHKSIRER